MPLRLKRPIKQFCSLDLKTSAPYLNFLGFAHNRIRIKIMNRNKCEILEIKIISNRD